MIKMLLVGLLFAVGLFVGGPAHAESAADFAFLQGVWASKTEFQSDDRKWSSATKTEATGQPILGGAMFVLDTAVPFPGATFVMRMTFAYDRFNKVYRVVVFDDINGYVDVYTGAKSEDGIIVVDNLTSGTAFPDGKGGMVYGRLKLTPGDGVFRIDADISTKVDRDWRPYMRMAFSPRM